MMNKKIPAVLAVASCCLGFSVPSFSGQKLDAINAQVDTQSNEIDQKYGVLLDGQERNDLKLNLIAKQALTDAIGGKSVQDIANDSYATYEITDPYEQRKLLIKLEAQVVKKGTGHGGNEPDYP